MSQQIPGGNVPDAATQGGQVVVPGQATGGPQGAPPAASYPTPQASPQQVIAQQVRTPETKDFYKTSEFLVWGLGVAALLIASGMIDDALDAPLVWRLIAILSSAYVLSRGFAKAAALRGERDIARDYGQTTGAGAGYGQGQPSAVDRAGDFAARHIATRETKEFFKTSEFAVWLLTVAGIFIASGVVDVYDAGEAWNHATWVTAAYVISRGLSKLGTRRDADRGYAGGVRY